MQNSIDIMTSSKPKVNSLHIPVTFFSSNNEEKFMLYGFKDTGASVTIVREGIIPQQLQSLHKTDDAATAANALNSDNVIDTTPVVTPAVDENENNLSWLYNDVHVGKISTAKLVELQTEDRTLDILFSRVTNESDSDNNEHVYVNDNGLLMRQWRNGTDYDVIDQIVLSYCLRSEVLKIAHDVPAAGHLGMTKTKNRILRYFY